MSRIIYVNGEFVNQEDAKVSVFDRGFLFGDGVYEVIPVVRSRLVEKQHAVERLNRSLSAIDMAWPCSKEEYIATLEELCRRNALAEGAVYMQVTRGVAERDFSYPRDTPTSFVAFTTARNLLDNPLAKTGVSVVSVDDLRWQRRDIKSLNLLGQCMAKQIATNQGAFEAWMVEDGQVTEGASSSAFIVKNGEIITRALSRSILPGIRRKVIIGMAQQHNLELIERSFSIEEACAADEAFLSSATTLVLPVISIDGRQIGNGKPGPLALKLRSLYISALLEDASAQV